MTGIVSSMADNAALGTFDAVLAGLGALLSFISGAGCSAILVNFARQRNMQSEFALPLMVEAILLLCFGLIGARLTNIGGLFVSLTVLLLAFIMGLQNAVITKLSNAEIRTTHVTGMVTDIGIELGKLIYRNDKKHLGPLRVTANRSKLRLLCTLVGFFFVGGVTGALGFHHLGYFATVPLALVLVALASVPVVDDLLAHWRSMG
ncbi:MAG: hypothetical protein JWQ01_3599 [Massilia sp.]|jgi:uncharacterized membrane protein YoaK (UPF0700 family)|nr:hypothetical protein [Massilia sp.]